MKQSQSVNIQGVGFTGLLTCIFAVGKIFGFLDWSWLWTFSPIWIPVALLIVIVVVTGLFTLLLKVVIGAIEWWDAWRAQVKLEKARQEQGLSKR